MSILKAGAAQAEITPIDSQFLRGYPHVERYSTGVHDPLLSAALYLERADEKVLIISNDIVNFTKDQVRLIRKAIAEIVPIQPARILISASHTHSGPTMVNNLSNHADSAVPDPDPAYIELNRKGIVAAAAAAYKNAVEAELFFCVADGSGVGTNRRDPSGVSDPEVPVLLAKNKDGAPICCMICCNMHPTVLHEDSKLVSADFPGAARQYLRDQVLGSDCTVLYHMGPAGNQSPRHVTRSNTFEESDRLGVILGKAVEEALKSAQPLASRELQFLSCEVELTPRVFLDVSAAEARLTDVLERFEKLKADGAPSQTVRTAECDWFGAEEALTLARAQQNGLLERVTNASMPAEIQIIKIGEMNFAAWPCEIFVEHGLSLKSKCENTYVISLANGESQGYIVTEEAEAEGGYEASNGMFTAESGRILVEATARLLGR